MSFNVTLSPSEKVIKVDEKTNLLEALRNVGIYIKSSCGGHASCSDCIVKIAEGTDNVAEPTFEEVQLLGNVFHITKESIINPPSVAQILHLRIIYPLLPVQPPKINTIFLHWRQYILKHIFNKLLI